MAKRVKHLEQYERMNNIIVPGLQIKPWLYAHAEPADNQGKQNSLTVSLWNNRFLTFSGPVILEVCHAVFRRNSKDQHAIIMRFFNRRNKLALLRQGRRLNKTMDLRNFKQRTSNYTDVFKVIYSRTVNTEKKFSTIQSKQT